MYTWLLLLLIIITYPIIGTILAIIIDETTDFDDRLSWLIVTLWPLLLIFGLLVLLVFIIPATIGSRIYYWLKDKAFH